MIDDPSPLEHMGTPSQETMAVEAAIARQAAGMGQAPDRSTEKLVDTLDAATGSGADAGSRISDAANWAVDKAKDAAQAAAHQVRKRATTAVESYTRDDPIRAILIAAGTGALLMSLVAMLARSGARSVRRRVRAHT